jgi:hypothetical protein
MADGFMVEDIMAGAHAEGKDHMIRQKPEGFRGQASSLYNNLFLRELSWIQR